VLRLPRHVVVGLDRRETDTCLANVDNAVRHGLANGATGFLFTDWGDFGPWQHPPASYLGFAAGGANRFQWPSETTSAVPSTTLMAVSSSIA
jgi:hypothetical protein